MADNDSPRNTTVYPDSDRFFNQLETDIKKARKSILIQCMSFEADSVGKKLINLLSSKPNTERILLIDCYSKYVVNDTFVYSPHGLLNKDNALKERRALSGLIEKARSSGIRIIFTNPMGFLLRNYPRRNHKKLVLIDEQISYVGGMNFNEHNFRWLDLMVRHEKPGIARALKKSFLGDLRGERVQPVQTVDDQIRIYTLNGYKTRNCQAHIIARIKNAKKVVAVSPYISYPILDAIAGVSDNRVIVPAANNKWYMNIAHRLGRYKNIKYHYIADEMVHMKLLIVDDHTALYGSSNFDTVSYLLQKEIIVEHKDPAVVRKLKRVVGNLTEDRIDP